MTMKRKHQITSLPKWAQDLILEERGKRASAEHDLQRLRQAHCLLENHDWFTVNSPCAEDEQPHKLWSLIHEIPHAVCSLGPGDILLVGRRKKDEQSERTEKETSAIHSDGS